MNRFRFIKVRDVKTPSRGNAGDAGLDFYIPRNLDPQQLIQIEANQSPNNFTPDFVLGVNTTTNFVTDIQIYPGGRILIPSGIKPLIEPQESMLMAANKSGLASKKRSSVYCRDCRFSLCRRDSYWYNQSQSSNTDSKGG